MPRLILTDITNVLSSANDLNNNFTAIENEFLNVISRVSPTSPNAMETDIDMNSRNIYNCKYLQAEDLRINGESFTDNMSIVNGLISNSQLILTEATAQAVRAEVAADSVVSITEDMSDQVNAAAASATLASGYATEAGNNYTLSAEQASIALAASVDAVAAAATIGTSVSDAAASAAAALVSENNAASSESNAATSESNAATSESNAYASEVAAAASAASINPSDFVAVTDIGSTVQAYDADTVVDASYVHTDNNYTNADAAVVAATSGSNTGDQDLSGYSLTSHLHTGTYEPADATILKDADIGSSVQAYDADLTTWAGKTAPSGTVVGTTDTQTLSAKSMDTIAVVSFQTPGTLTTTTGAVTADWSANQNLKQNEPTGAITYTFTAPAGPCHLQLFIDSDGTSTAYTHVFPGTVIWMGATWAQVANKKAVINFWYDGTNYYAMGANEV
jgi:hypothetical protein